MKKERKREREKERKREREKESFFVYDKKEKKEVILI